MSSISDRGRRLKPGEKKEGVARSLTGKGGGISMELSLRSSAPRSALWDASRLKKKKKSPLRDADRLFLLQDLCRACEVGAYQVEASEAVAVASRVFRWRREKEYSEVIFPGGSLLLAGAAVDGRILRRMGSWPVA